MGCVQHWKPGTAQAFRMALPGRTSHFPRASCSSLAREPEPHPWVPEARLDATLEAFADFVDVKSPYTAGHSRGVAALAAEAWPADPVTIRRTGLVHDLGRVSVPNGIWDKPSPLTEGEWERVRLHPYHSERILLRVTRLEPLAGLAGAHHERVDGSGYHRGSKRPDLPPPAVFWRPRTPIRR